MLPVVSVTGTTQSVWNTQLIAGALTSTTLSSCALAVAETSKAVANVAGIVASRRIALSLKLAFGSVSPVAAPPQGVWRRRPLRRLHLVARRHPGDRPFLVGHVGRNIGKQRRREVALAGVRQHGEDVRARGRI